MIRILGGSKCNTDTALLVGECDGERMYRNRAGKYFLVKGGDASLWDYASAKKWCKTKLTVAQYEAEFNYNKLKNSKARVCVLLSPDTNAVLRDEQKRTGKSLSDIVCEAVAQYCRRTEIKPDENK